MGGRVFLQNDPPLSTPRMPPKVFNIVLEEVLTSLRKQYTHVESPLEAPKEDYGDIDLVIFGPLSSAYDANVSRAEAAKSLSSLLNAKAFVAGAGNSGMHFAVSWPAGHDADPSDVEDSTDVVHASDGKEVTPVEKYIQIDIHHLSSLETYSYRLFKGCHGDLWIILNQQLTILGFIANDDGLCVQLRGSSNMKKENVCSLTLDPREILRFLGMDWDRYWKPFESLQELFNYAASSRFYTHAYRAFAKSQASRNKRSLNSKKAKVAEKRGAFAMWMEDFVPAAHAPYRQQRQATFSRKSTLAEVLQKFGVKEEYEKRSLKIAQHRNREEIRQAIKSGVSKQAVGNEIDKAAIKAFISVFIEKKCVDGVKVPRTIGCDQDGIWNVENVRSFVVGNWKIWGEAWIKMQKERALENQKRRKLEADQPARAVKVLRIVK